MTEAVDYKDTFRLSLDRALCVNTRGVLRIYNHLRVIYRVYKMYININFTLKFRSLIKFTTYHHNSLQYKTLYCLVRG